jgi:DNA invertase Pin-like site-specific DNA recombinase
MNLEYGYVRVSTKGQNTDRQRDALLALGIPGERIYADRRSGKSFDRPEYRRLTETLTAGDTVFITSIDRLGRNYQEILDQWHRLTKKMGVDIVVLDMPLLDTRQKGRDLTGTFVADLVLQILSYVAETERANIRQRQAEGIASAKARGVHFGNPGKPLPEGFEEAALSWRRGEVKLADALAKLGIGRTYFFQNIKKLGL